MMPEQFKIKTVEPIKLISKKERIQKIKNAGYNLFNLKSKDILIDLLTDSGTSAMSSNQWSRLMLGDESYAGSTSFEILKKTVKTMLGFKYLLPTHQGRPAENILMSLLVKKGNYVLGNTHFDSTMAHIQANGGIGVNLVTDDWKNSTSLNGFKGNVDLEKLEKFIIDKGSKNISLFLMTITNNAGGGQPVSLNNIKRAREITSKYKIPFYLDIARFAENSYFNKIRNSAYSNKTILQIVKETMSYADGAVMSAKKDGLVNIGGFIALNDKQLFNNACKMLILLEGYITYGGLSGRDIEALNQGLNEVVDESYLRYRTGQVEYFGRILDKNNIPVIKPFGGHAVYINASKFYPHIKKNNFPGQTLAVELYISGWIRSVEIVSFALSRKDPESGITIKPEMELTRLALPRRVYTQSHIDYAAEIIFQVYNSRNKARGFKIISDKNDPLRHFTAKLSYC